MTLHPNYPVCGCDVSFWQGDINFDQMIDAGIWFVIIKSSEGSYNDPNYQNNKTGAIQAGLPFGAYHFWRPGYTASQNTLAMDRQVPNRPPVGCWLDLEAPSDNLTRLQTSAHIYQTLIAMDINYNSLTGIYCNQASWRRLIDPSYYDRLDLDKRPLWVANYFDTFVNQPHLPDGWTGWLFWQYKIYDSPGFGVSSKKIDIDAFNGTEQEFYEFIGGVIEPPPPPKEPPMQVKTKFVCNIRNNPDLTQGSDVGNLEAGKVLNVIAEIAEFYKVETYVAKSVVEPVIIPPPPTVPEYFVCHDFAEVTFPNGKVMPSKGKVRAAAPNPEVYWLNETMVKLTAAWQQLIYDMNQPYMTAKAFRGNLRYNVAWANDTGFDEPGDPRRDYINKLNLEAKYPFLDKCRICGGATIRGTEANGMLTVEVLDGSQPPPKWSDLKLKPWLYFRAYIVNTDGSVFDFPYCGGQPLYMPLVGIPPVVVKLNLNEPDKPTPYIVGL